jgi:signal transduction histidine kinase
VELCCYRVVQEALTNAGRHARGCEVKVELRYGPQALTVRVANNARAGQRGRGPGVAPGHPGYGLTGLRERVAMLRGEFTAGPGQDGGFVVCAVLPATRGGGDERP